MSLDLIPEDLVNPSGSNGDVLTTVSGRVQWAPPTAGAGELLMQDGVTGPPVPLETEARSDWLYQG